jgi:hypothetical protein
MKPLQFLWGIGNENDVTVTICYSVSNGNDVIVTVCGNDAHLWLRGREVKSWVRGLERVRLGGTVFWGGWNALNFTRQFQTPRILGSLVISSFKGIVSQDLHKCFMVPFSRS